jgi:hypothetical protein
MESDSLGTYFSDKQAYSNQRREKRGVPVTRTMFRLQVIRIMCCVHCNIDVRYMRGWLMLCLIGARTRRVRAARTTPGWQQPAAGEDACMADLVSSLRCVRRSNTNIAAPSLQSAPTRRYIFPGRCPPSTPSVHPHQSSSPSSQPSFSTESSVEQAPSRCAP